MGSNYLVHAVGFFNDSYDLFVMNIVNVILEEQYSPEVYNHKMKSMVSMGVFAGSVLGQLVFGYYADRLGRQRIMIFTAALLILGGVLCTSAYVGNDPPMLFIVLTVYRAILGIGGEYPLSSTTSAEGCPPEKRGRAVASTFAMQGIGALAAAFCGNLLVQTLFRNPAADHGNLELIWRLLFGIGTVPAILIFYPRLKSEESISFKRNPAASTFNENAIADMELDQKPLTVVYLDDSLPTLSMRLKFICKNYGRRLFGAAMPWFLFDIVFYSQSIFQASTLKALNLGGDLQMVTLQCLYISLIMLPGYFVAIMTIDKIGRRKMQLQGFLIMALLFGAMGIWWKEILNYPKLFVALYAATFFFSNFGPNTTTFIIPVEAFPTALRATCHGFSAAAGKIGALVGASAFEKIVELTQVDLGNGEFDKTMGYQYTFITCSVLCLISIPITWWFVQDRVGELKLLDEELQTFLTQEPPATRESLSLAFRKSEASYYAQVSPTQPTRYLR